MVPRNIVLSPGPGKMESPGCASLVKVHGNRYRRLQLIELVEHFPIDVPMFGDRHGDM
ncbi:hypothetical protein M422DRAFT_36446 [Sphaerobolus stellatus SS14]|uniref:Uncharacterized protein n=1 Tax=Sphaerobolus stellatus (strain SS14) TaxID=990650 RepID=A0A0C9UP82_SPHS4|nr:hypothetical protein M422DRAFT_36446 [Sphaerobolus stellatus SS14]